jgi:hypothetical protein
LAKGRAINVVLFAFSMVILLSTLMTIHGQATAGIMARLLFKSSKVIPTTIMEILFLILSGQCVRPIDCSQGISFYPTLG